MPYLVIFKRFEVWLLLSLLGGLFLYLIWPDGVGAATAEVPGPSVSPAASVLEDSAAPPRPKALVVTSVGRRDLAATPAQQGMILDLTLFGRTKGDGAVVLTEANLRVQDESGQVVPRFFEPFTPEATFVPEENREARIALWWSGSGEKLWVEWEGEKVPVDLSF